MKKKLEQQLREVEKGYYCTIKDCLVVIELYKKALRAEKRKVKELEKEANESWQQKKRKYENYNLLGG